MLTDYHLHLRPDEDGHAAGALLHRGERRALPGRRRRRPGSRSSASPSTSTASRQALELWRHPFWEEQAPRRPRRLLRVRRGDAAAARDRVRLRPGAEDRTATCSSRATSTTWSARSTSSATTRRRPRRLRRLGGDGDPDEVWRRYFESIAECARSGLFDILAHPDLVKVWGGARPLPERDPRRYYEPAVEAIAESGIAVEVSTAGLRKPVGEIYPAPRVRRDVRRGGRRLRPLLRRPPPEQVGFGYERALEFLAGLGVARSASSRDAQRRLAPLGRRVGEERPDGRRDRLRQPPLRRGPPPGPRRGRDRARARPRRPLRRRRPHPRGDRRPARRRRRRRHRHALPRRRRALARRRLDRPAAHRGRHDRRPRSSTSTRP